MPPTVEDRLRDILEAIAEIEEMLAGSSLDLFAADKMRRMATERYLESDLRGGTKAYRRRQTGGA